MHIVLLYHRNTTHITSLHSIFTRVQTLTEALNQVNVKKIVSMLILGVFGGLC